jgi:hypothetical protein
MLLSISVLEGIAELARRLNAVGAILAQFSELRHF